LVDEQVETRLVEEPPLALAGEGYLWLESLCKLIIIVNY
jgi:hypothetical protein